MKNLRCYNFLIDSIIFFSILFFSLFLLKNYISKDQVKLIAVLFYFLYYFSFEMIWLKTPAKFFTKTEVSIINGKNKFQSICLRSMIRIFPLDILSYLIFNKGFHDKFSNSQTIKTLKK